MVTQDQGDVLAFLGSPATHGGAEVERIDTHASVVFLAGDRAWKVKRAVRYDYLDFSTLERRRAMCEAELRVNRRTAPRIYRGVVAVTRDASGALALGGSGTPVEWVLEMARFDEEQLFDRLAARHALDLAFMRPLALAIARVHHDAERVEHHGGYAGMRWVIDGNEQGLVSEGRDLLDQAAIARVSALARAEAKRLQDLLDERRRGGLVRRGHGDLHLGNIVLDGGVPTLFDAVEFNDEISCTDVLYDVAFLLMDFWRRGLTRHASAVWNTYLLETGELEGLALVPLFLSCRAAVRAKTSITAANLEAAMPRRRELVTLAREYLAMAERLLAPAPPSLLAIGGLSGSGKSTLAASVAPLLGPVPGAVVIRSDEVRKQLAGVDPLVRLGAEGYTAEMSRRVYAAVAGRAVEVVRAGYTAIVDAVFGDEHQRDTIERAAEVAHGPFAGVWLDAAEPVLFARATGRAGDASDADAVIVRAQLRQEHGAIRWTRLDGAQAIERLVGAAAATVRGARGAFAARCEGG